MPARSDVIKLAYDYPFEDAIADSKWRGLPGNKFCGHEWRDWKYVYARVEHLQAVVARF